MKRKNPWTLDEKLMVFGPTLFIAGFGAFSWQESRTKVIKLPVMHSYSEPSDGIHDINKIEFSPDSQRFVAVYQAESGGVAAVFDARTLTRLTDLQIPPVPAGSPAISPVIQDACWALDGQTIAGIYDDGVGGTTKIKTDYKPFFRFNNQVKIASWNSQSGDLIWKRLYAKTRLDSGATLRISSDGKKLLGQGTPSVLFDAVTGAPLTANNDGAPIGKFNFDGSLIAVTHQNKKLLEVRDVKINHALWRPHLKPFYPQWSKNNVFGVGDYRAKNDQRLLLWDGTARRVLPAPPFHNVDEFALHPRRTWVAFAEVKFQKLPTNKGANPTFKVESSTLRVWDYATQQDVWQRPMSGPMALSWSPDGRWLCAVERASGFPQATLWIFDAQGKIQSRFNRGAVNFVEWSPDSKTLAIAELNQIEIIAVDRDL